MVGALRVLNKTHPQTIAAGTLNGTLRSPMLSVSVFYKIQIHLCTAVLA